MRAFTKAIATISVTAALLAVGATAAQATTAYPEGGTWNYGVTGSYTKSDYYHAGRSHKSTAVGVNMAITPWTNPGYWARAQAISALGGNKAYYNVR